MRIYSILYCSFYLILYFICFNLIYNEKKIFLEKNILYLNCRENASAKSEIFRL